MRLWLFEDTDPRNEIYGRFASLLIMAKSKRDAEKIVRDRLEDFPRQDVRDFKIHEVDLAKEDAGVLTSEFIDG